MADEFRTPPRRPNTTPPRTGASRGVQTPPKRSDDSDLWFWILTIVLLFTAWPFGLFLLLSKFSDGKKKKPNTTRVTTAAASKPSAPRTAVQKVTKKPVYSAGGINAMKITGIALAGVGALCMFGLLADNLSLYLHDLVWFLEDMFVPAGFLCTGFGLMLGAGKMKRRVRRFGKYLACAGKQEAIPIHQLALAVGVSDGKAEKDLELMVEKGLWGEGAYVDAGRDILFRSPEAAQAYFARTEKPRRQAAPVSEESATGYEAMLGNIRRANERIDDPVLSEKIDRIEDLSAKIIRAITDQPEKKDKAATFFHYYLPTTQKLLDNYADFEEAGVSGKNLSDAKAKIEATMDNIVAGFEHQLDALYQAEALDIDSDIRVMETLLRRDTTSAEDDFGLGGATAVQAPDVEME